MLTDFYNLVRFVLLVCVLPHILRIRKIKYKEHSVIVFIKGMCHEQ